MLKKRKRGRPPKLALCQIMAKLRQAGRSFAEIGRILGVSKQSVYALLKRHGKKIVPRAKLLCQGCSRLIHKVRPKWSRQNVWCLKCLQKMPDAPFSVRLKAFRLSLRMSQEELAARTDLTVWTIQYHEQYVSNPKWKVLVKLVKVFGSRLVCV
jgi:DNA-binding XRE family transcriptional regulator